MKARIKIIPHKVGDGGILCYPMESNIPVPKDSSWKDVGKHQQQGKQWQQSQNSGTPARCVH